MLFFSPLRLSRFARFGRFGRFSNTFLIVRHAEFAQLNCDLAGL